MIPFYYDSQRTHIEVLIPPEILKKLRKYLFSYLSFLDKQWRDVNSQSESPLRELKKVLTITFKVSIKVATKSFVLSEISFANVDHAFNIGFNLQSFYFEWRVVKKQYFLTCQIVSVESVICELKSQMKVRLSCFFVSFLGIKSEILNPSAQCETFCKIKKLRKYSFASERFGYKNRTYPPDLLILIS